MFVVRNNVVCVEDVAEDARSKREKQFSECLAAGLCDRIMEDLTTVTIQADAVRKSDQEPAIASLLDEVCRVRAGTRTEADTSSQGDARANGWAESAVQLVEGMIRVGKLALETRLATWLFVVHTVFPRLVEH